MTAGASIRRVRLHPGGGIAEIAPDPVLPGTFTLSIAGTMQSHVDPADPGTLFHDYVRRIGFAVDRIRLPGEPLVALHLGAGALTLARYLQSTRPGSEQHVVDLEANLVAFVTDALPLPAGTSLTEHPGDAARQVRGLATRLGGRCDVVIADLYQGLSTPAHLQTTGFFGDVARLLTAEGVLLINVADDPGLPTLRRQLAALSPVFGHVLVLGPQSVVDGREAGNTVVAASRSDVVLGWAGALRAAGPHPGSVRLGSALLDPLPATGSLPDTGPLPGTGPLPDTDPLPRAASGAQNGRDGG
ncbi:spermidine synthase [Herbiconiux sp. YIM B11900]|uniref:spermidine synthase n=1 Tax=Herbiconiux sp. YIM B11900 TaxID=3404131 RepID=UPI003F8630DC